jgi:ferrochelatase
VTPYDALLVVSFGGPEGPEDVLPFLDNVLRGRPVSEERKREVAEHYFKFGGVSPINDQCRALIAALETELAAHGPRLPIYWGNRNWHPLLSDTVKKMADDGVRAAVGERAPEIDKLRVFFNHPGFVEPLARNLGEALGRIPEERRDRAAVAFTAHSIPLSMAAGCDYEAQLRETCRLVAKGAGRSGFELVFQSRSGAPTQPWLEPDILEHLQALRGTGNTDVVVVPVGFISDHMEVVYDLDTEAAERAAALGLNMIRAATVGVAPEFVSMIRELVLERTQGAERRALGDLGPRWDVCAEDCCLPGRGRPADASALAGPPPR